MHELHHVFAHRALGRPEPSGLTAEPVPVEVRGLRQLRPRVLRMAEPWRKRGSLGVDGREVGVDQERKNGMVERRDRHLYLSLLHQVSVERHDVSHDRELSLENAHDVVRVEAPALLDELPYADIFSVVKPPRLAAGLGREPRDVEPRLEVIDVRVGEGAALAPHAQELRVARVDLYLVPPVGVEEARDDEVLVRVGQMLRRGETELHPEVGGSVLDVVLELDDH